MGSRSRAVQVILTPRCLKFKNVSKPKLLLIPIVLMNQSHTTAKNRDGRHSVVQRLSAFTLSQYLQI